MRSACLLLVAAYVAGTAQAFAPSSPLLQTTRNLHRTFAGGFEWDDPDGDAFDQGVENPFKKEDESSEEFKVNAARLLSPRLNGSNLYLVGMMGSGKSAVGQIVAKRAFCVCVCVCCCVVYLSLLQCRNGNLHVHRHRRDY